MKSKWVKILSFIFIVVLLDKTAGLVCKKLYDTCNEYNIYRLRYILDSTKEDVLIFGSSRAESHFIPSIFTEGTGLSVYNCGVGGEGVFFSLIQLNESLKRYKPKFIIVEVSPNVLLDQKSNEKLQILKPFYKKDRLIYDALTQGKLFEKIKYISSIYPYNSTLLSLINGHLKTPSDQLRGFRPLDGIIDTSHISEQINNMFSESVIPIEKFIPLKKFIAFCRNNNIKVAVVSSPVYQINKHLDAMLTQIRTICLQEDKDIFFLDFSTYAPLYKKRVYFKDNMHLNSTGAKLFSEAISKDLRKLY